MRLVDEIDEVRGGSGERALVFRPNFYALTQTQYFAIPVAAEGRLNQALVKERRGTISHCQRRMALDTNIHELSHIDMAESFVISCPDRKPLGAAGSMEMALKALFLCPVYFILAWFQGCPGLGLHFRTVLHGIRLFITAPSKEHARWIYYPVESTRYFEVSFALRNVGDAQTWLDVSSPRIFAASLLRTLPYIDATLLNPDRRDLDETGVMLKGLGLKASLAAKTIQDYAARAEFDLISTISVLEHIDDDTGALRRIWDLLKPGGRLIITLPVNVKGGIQYMERDPYDLVKTAAEPCFFQRFYSISDLSRLEEIVGQPKVAEVFGDVIPGWLQSNFARKRSEIKYPVWQEPLLMANNWKRYDRLADLPGEGVYCAVYEKPLLK